VWGGRSAKTFNIRLTALASACGYRREQGWLTGDPLVRLRARPAPPDTSKASSCDRIAEILGSDAPLRERVLWHMFYESSARAEEVLLLDVPDLDAGNRCAVVTRKGRRPGDDRVADRYGPVAGRPSAGAVASHRSKGSPYGGRG
jgi:integrase/recombinase XerC/integrase/recombinase XerD